MDYINHPNSKVQNQLLSHKSKRSIKLLLYFSLSCVLFSLLPFVLQFFKPFFMQFYGYMVDKTYMFLLCNGLLVLIAINSPLINASSPSPPIIHQTMQHAVPVQRMTPIEEINVSADVIGDENVVETETPQEEEKSLMIIEQENVVSDKVEDEEEGNAIVIVDEDEHDDAGDTEELNKKCEDFIKRMKAALKDNPY